MLWIIVGLLYVGVAGYLFYNRYVMYPRERFQGLLAFHDWQANILISIWPLTTIVSILFIVYVRAQDYWQERKK